MFGLYWIFMKHKIQGYFSTYCLPIRSNNCGKYKHYVNCFLLRIFVTAQQLAPPAYYFLLWWLSNWHHQVSIIYFYDCPVDAIITFLCNTFCDYPTDTIISFLYHTYFLWLPNWHYHQFSIPYLVFVTAQRTLSSVFYTILSFCDCPTDTIISFLYHTYFLRLPNEHNHQFSMPYLVCVTAQRTLSSVFYTLLTFCDCPTDTIISFLCHTFCNCPTDTIISFLCHTFCDCPTDTIISFLYHTYFLWLPNWHYHQFSIPYLLFVTAQRTQSSVFYTILFETAQRTLSSVFYTILFVTAQRTLSSFSIPYLLFVTDTIGFLYYPFVTANEFSIQYLCDCSTGSISFPSFCDFPTGTIGFPYFCDFPTVSIGFPYFLDFIL